MQTHEISCRRAFDGSVELRLNADQAAQLVTIFKALSHPVRLQIIDLLSRYGGQVCVCEIEAQFDLKQPTISHHLKVLREAGLVGAEQQGLWVYYDIRPEAFVSLRGVLELVEAHEPAPPYLRLE